ncbi:MAG: hypothetical protein IJS28_03000 [Synergistaceae bacterium]|nr:hypothetical protein [Synergistaceae bacterium]
MPLSKSRKINEPVSQPDEDAAAFQRFLDGIIAAWKKFWGLLLSGSITFEEFLAETGDFFDKHITSTEDQKNLEYVGGTLTLSLEGRSSIAVDAKLYYKRPDSDEKAKLVIQELKNNVTVDRFSDWETSQDAKDLRRFRKLEYPIDAPEM